MGKNIFKMRSRRFNIDVVGLKANWKKKKLCGLDKEEKSIVARE